MEEETVHTELPNLKLAIQEMETGIFNMVVALAQSYSQVISPVDARERTAVWLESIVKGLRMTEQLPHNTKES